MDHRLPYPTRCIYYPDGHVHYIRSWEEEATLIAQGGWADTPAAFQPAVYPVEAVAEAKATHAHVVLMAVPTDPQTGDPVDVPAPPAERPKRLRTRKVRPE